MFFICLKPECNNEDTEEDLPECINEDTEEDSLLEDVMVYPCGEAGAALPQEGHHPRVAGRKAPTVKIIISG